jgi:hypothetical protein
MFSVMFPDRATLTVRLFLILDEFGREVLPLFSEPNVLWEAVRLLDGRTVGV